MRPMQSQPHPHRALWNSAARSVAFVTLNATTSGFALAIGGWGERTRAEIQTDTLPAPPLAWHCPSHDSAPRFQRRAPSGAAILPGRKHVLIPSLWHRRGGRRLRADGSAVPWVAFSSLLFLLIRPHRSDEIAPGDARRGKRAYRGDHGGLIPGDQVDDNEVSLRSRRASRPRRQVSSATSAPTRKAANA